MGGTDLSGMVNLGQSFTNVPGGIAHWTFSDPAGNYNPLSGDVLVAINAAPMYISMTFGQTIDSLGIATGVNVNNQRTVAGSYSFATLDPMALLHAGTYADKVTFTPDDGTMPITMDVVVTVAKADWFVKADDLAQFYGKRSP